MNFDDYRGIWIYIEVKDGQIAPVSLELLGAGRVLADKRKTELAGVFIGSGVKALAPTLFQYGADVVYVYDDPILNITEQNHTCALCLIVAISINQKSFYTGRRHLEKIWRVPSQLIYRQD